jgi:hypothetical protein
MSDYSDSFTSIQLHLGDPYWIEWNSERATFYSISGTPTTWFDGVLRLVGVYTNDAQMYEWYQDQIVARLAVPTDVTVALSAVESATQTYDITATVGIEAGGEGKDLWLHFVQVLDYYPYAADNRYRNCVMQHADGDTHTLAAGESIDITIPFTISGVSWTYVEDVKIIVFAQEPGNHAPRDVYNAAVMEWPFTSSAIEGDVDGDGDVDLEDLAALLAMYGLCLGDDGYNDAADFVDNDCIDLSDLSALLSNYGYGT